MTKPAELKKNDIYSARITGYTSEGAGVCRIGERAVFVPGTISGEEWDVRIVRSTSAVVWGRGETLRAASPHRVEPDCPVYPRCGGCALRHMDYEEELSLKLQRANDALHRIGKLNFSISGILPALEDARQRRKVIFNVAEQNGHPVAGFYRARSHDVVPVPDCPAVPQAALACERTVLDWMEREHIPVYDEAAKKDGVRHIFYRSSHLTENTVLTLTASRSPGEKALGILTDMLRERCPEITGLVLNRNTARGNTVLAGEFDTVWGSDILTEGLCGLTFTLSPRSFFQVNPPQAERLYEAALGFAGITPGMTALDLYCGTGTIGLCMASRGANVIGAEVIPAAVENARDNARRNGLSESCEFLCADAGEAAAELARRGIRPQVIVVDPPRRGLDESVISHAVGMQPERIVYVSCDPGTLARDLASFARQGYAPVDGIAVDMFPRTSHVETVCLLSKLQSKEHIEIEVKMDELDLTSAESKATYEEIKAYVLEHTGLKVSSLYIAQVKQKHGIIERENYNKPKSEDTRQPQCPPDKERAITEALKHFGMI